VWAPVFTASGSRVRKRFFFCSRFYIIASCSGKWNRLPRQRCRFVKELCRTLFIWNRTAPQWASNSGRYQTELLRLSHTDVICHILATRFFSLMCKNYFLRSHSLNDRVTLFPPKNGREARFSSHMGMFDLCFCFFFFLLDRNHRQFLGASLLCRYETAKCFAPKPRALDAMIRLHRQL
jgi:hypothetical protein